jgi:large subunit ribosomal protein L4
VARLPVLSAAGKPLKDLELPDEVFATPLNSHLIQEAVVAYQAAGRAGTHANLNRSDVRGGGKKPWKQKKTGRSRHGSIRSPLWRGGGKVFGPRPRDYSYAFPRRKRQGALRSVLSAKLKEGRLLIVESLALAAPKTKELVRLVQGLGIKGSALLVDEPVDQNLALSARNIPRVKTTLGTALNVVDLLYYETVVLTEAAAQRVAEVLHR